MPRSTTVGVVGWVWEVSVCVFYVRTHHEVLSNPKGYHLLVCYPMHDIGG